MKEQARRLPDRRGRAADRCRWSRSSSATRWVRIIDVALLYVLLALGLNIVVGYAGLLDLGYVAFYAVGAYMFALLASPHLTDTFAGHQGDVPERAAHADLDRRSRSARRWPASPACCSARRR